MFSTTSTKYAVSQISIVEFSYSKYKGQMLFKKQVQKKLPQTTYSLDRQIISDSKIIRPYLWFVCIWVCKCVSVKSLNTILNTVQVLRIETKAFRRSSIPNILCNTLNFLSVYLYVFQLTKLSLIFSQTHTLLTLTGKLYTQTPAKIVT